MNDDMLLSEARAWTRARAREGVECPLCTQRVQVYRFAINASMACALIRIWRAGGSSWVDVPALDLPHNLHAHLSKLRFWGLLDRPEGARREDGSTRVGAWRVTDEGVRWLRGEERVPSHALLFNNRCLGLEGAPTSIRDALGKRFDYDELMGGG